MPILENNEKMQINRKAIFLDLTGTIVHKPDYMLESHKDL